MRRKIKPLPNRQRKQAKQAKIAGDKYRSLSLEYASGSIAATENFNPRMFSGSKSLREKVQAGLRKKSEGVQKMRSNFIKNATPEELHLLPQLEKLGFVFQDAQLGYYPDFCHREKKLIVELDGDFHYDDPDQVAHDHKRRLVFESHGYKILRFQNYLVWQSTSKLVDQIKKALN